MKKPRVVVKKLMNEKMNDSYLYSILNQGR